MKLGIMNQFRILKLNWDNESCSKMINLKHLMNSNNRMTRVVLGMNSSMDISTIFETHQKDFLTGEEITDKNFDSDDVYYIQELGYTKRTSLLAVGITKVVNIDSIYSNIYSKNLK